ncbi:MAG: VTT domain-containing protein [Oscillibacter sp.]|jgi:uncharacterized membrane protein YdjX (TVP38/TMEM64 family)|nr:VTT domain-containing protein [Oscillibacter sp.]
MKNNRKKNIWITIGICAGIGVLLFVFFWLLPTLFQKWISEEDIERFLSGTSGWQGLVYLAVFQAAQVLSVFFPGMAVQIAGGLVFGIWKSYLICLLSFVATNVAVFALARRRNAHPINPETKRGRRVQKVLDWINSSDPAFMCMLAYMMPGIPNGFVPYAAVHTEVSLKRFAASVTLGSCIQILIMCSIGSRIMAGDFAISFFLVLGSIALIFILYRTKDRIIAYRQKSKQPDREPAEKH